MRPDPNQQGDGRAMLDETTATLNECKDDVAELRAALEYDQRLSLIYEALQQLRYTIYDPLFPEHQFVLF